MPMPIPMTTLASPASGAVWRMTKKQDASRRVLRSILLTHGSIHGGDRMHSYKVARTLGFAQRIIIITGLCRQQIRRSLYTYLEDSSAELLVAIRSAGDESVEDNVIELAGQRAAVDARLAIEDDLQRRGEDGVRDVAVEVE